VLLSDMDDDGPTFGPFFEFHRAAFAPVRGVEKMSTLAMMGQPTCFARLITTVPRDAHFGIPYYKNVSDFSLGSGSARPRKTIGQCGASPYIVGLSRFVRAAFGLHQGARPWRRTPHVTILERRPYHREIHVDKPYTVKRVISNFAKLEEGIASLCVKTRETSHTAKTCTHSTHDFAALPIAGQMALATATDVLVGTHSAALTFLIYLPPHACVVEFATNDDWHYDNLALYAGICHFRGSGRAGHSIIEHNADTIRLDVRPVLGALQTALDRVGPHVHDGVQAVELPPVLPREVEWPTVKLTRRQPPPPAPKRVNTCFAAAEHLPQNKRAAEVLACQKRRQEKQGALLLRSRKDH